MISNDFTKTNPLPQSSLCRLLIGVQILLQIFPLWKTIGLRRSIPPCTEQPQLKRKITICLRDMCLISAKITSSMNDSWMDIYLQRRVRWHKCQSSSRTSVLCIWNYLKYKCAWFTLFNLVFFAWKRACVRHPTHPPPSLVLSSRKELTKLKSNYLRGMFKLLNVFTLVL